MGVANCLAVYDAGVQVFDGSVGGLGGCPYAKGATGNVPTEALVYLFEGMGVATGVDMRRSGCGSRSTSAPRSGGLRHPLSPGLSLVA